MCYRLMEEGLFVSVGDLPGALLLKKMPFPLPLSLIACKYLGRVFCLIETVLYYVF